MTDYMETHLEIALHHQREAFRDRLFLRQIFLVRDTNERFEVLKDMRLIPGVVRVALAACAEDRRPVGLRGRSREQAVLPARGLPLPPGRR